MEANWAALGSRERRVDRVDSRVDKNTVSIPKLLDHGTGRVYPSHPW